MPRKKRRRSQYVPPSLDRRQWFAFPVLVAFASGAFLMSLLWSTAPVLAFGLMLVAAVVIGIGLSRITTGLVARWIIRRRQAKAALQSPSRPSEGEKSRQKTSTSS